MSFGIDEYTGPRSQPEKRKGVQTLGDCKQGDIVEIDGIEMRVAFFCSPIPVAGVYPAADGYIAKDGKNLRTLPVATRIQPVRLVP